jgi:hypothetical protein
MLCLEDASEATYAYRVIASVLSRDFPSIARTHRDEFLKTLTKGNFRMYTPFVACFCEEGDLLSQWRGYGGRGEGLALEFKVSWLHSLRRRGFLLRRVIYRRNLQRAFISKYVQGALDLFTHHHFSGDDAKWFWGCAAVAASDLIVTIKDPAFKGEREWRLFNPTIIGGKYFKYRRSGSRLVPYVTVPIKREAIVGVIRGPHFAGTDSRGIEHALLYNEFTGASNRVRDSKVPIRR